MVGIGEDSFTDILFIDNYSNEIIKLEIGEKALERFLKYLIIFLYNHIKTGKKEVKLSLYNSDKKMQFDIIDNNGWAKVCSNNKGEMNKEGAGSIKDIVYRFLKVFPKIDKKKMNEEGASSITDIVYHFLSVFSKIDKKDYSSWKKGYKVITIMIINAPYGILVLDDKEDNQVEILCIARDYKEDVSMVKVSKDEFKNFVKQLTYYLID